MSTGVTTNQKGLEPFTPQLTQQLPGGSLILDQNLLRIKKHFDALTPLVSQITRTLNIRTSGGGTATGSGGMTFDFGDNEYSANDAGGAETWLAERTCPFGNAAAGVFQLSLFAQGLSTAGSGTFRLRSAGTTGLPDGPVLAAILVFGASYHTIAYGPVGVANPGDTRLLKLTGQPSAAGQTAKLTSVSLVVR